MIPKVDPDIRKAEGLPAECFTSPAFLDLELATIFAAGWTLLPDRSADELRRDPRALAELVSVRGARAPVSLLGRPLFLQRDWESDALRLFPNACTHAWFPLVQGPSRGPSMTCAQHGRKFGCDGRFVSQPGFDGVENFPRDCDHLRALPLAKWNGAYFAGLGEPAEPFATTFAPVDESLALLPLADLRRVASAGSVREVDGNWKLHATNYMDSYHVTWIHRAPGGLADRLDMTSYRTELLGRASLQWAWARDPSHGFDPALLPERFRDPSGKGRRVFALWWFVFPSTAINVYPWGISINSWQPVPGDPSRTLFTWEHLVLDPAAHARRDEIWLSAQVDAEDVDAMAQVRQGLRAGVAPRTRFAPEHETGPHWFHRLVAEGVAPGAP